MTASGVLSVPFCAAWAKTCLLARLLFSNWIRAVSCSVSLVLMLFPGTLDQTALVAGCGAEGND